VAADGPYTRAEWIRAVNLAALLGWSGVVLPIAIVTAFAGSIGHAITALLLLGFVGLPLAFAGSWIIGAPVLRYLMRRPVGWFRAALWGGGIAGTMKVIAIAFGEWQLWKGRQSNSSFSAGTAGGQTIEDHTRTAYGWEVILWQSAIFILIGVLAGVAVRYIIGPGRRP
jgi:hypothetical protein